jgi:hypothetical protein
LSKFWNAVLLATALTAPAGLIAQEHRDSPAKVYQDKKHSDTHEWNSDEDQRYRTYLKENHRKYRDFNKLKEKDQNAYWDWRHQH